ncbi:tetratricopeptide repeat protein [Oribacterium sp. Sow4_G1_1]|uniref:tetratricopeptide repeat protein n=1 Tax=Oribacterium sp. Sow4_G1_1 TaxID=3438794 RepID=UPI003F9E599E
MDKYEFNIKAEQMRKMAEQGDYKTAMQIADTIDWRRVRNANLLSYVADIYEHNSEYEEAKDILLLAFERAPVGKRFLYKLAEISVKAGDLQDAQEFYHEFCEMSPDDSRQFLLRYLILKAKGASAEQLIAPLEEYTSLEVDEEWLYTLAKLYSEAGCEDACVRTCDKIMLLFGLGQYVDKAMELKLQYRSLSKEQMDLVENRSKYEEKLRKVSEEYADTDGNLVEAQSPVVKAEVDAELAAETQSEGTTDTITTPLSEDVQPSSEESATIYQKSAEANAGDQPAYTTAADSMAAATTVSTAAVTDPIVASSTSAQGAAQTSNHDMQCAAADAVKAIQSAVHKIPQKEEELHNYHMIIEAKTRADGLKIAIDEIKYFHDLYGFNFKVAKTDATRLNERGFAAFVPKIAGKDLIVENAGALTYDVVDEISDYIDTLTDSSSVVLVDVMDHFDRMAEDRPLFIKKFDLVSDIEEEEDELVEDVDLDAPVQADAAVENEETAASMTVQKPSPAASFSEDRTPVPLHGTENRSAEADAPDKYVDTSAVPVAAAASTVDSAYAESQKNQVDSAADAVDYPAETADADGDDEEALTEEDADTVANEAAQPEEPLPGDYYQEMSVEDFANYAQQYAREIDCVLVGKTVLALYERIEMMQEDGVELTKESAEELIEEAADKAEAPSLGKKLTGMFHPKYDKENRLILREDNFIG